MKHFVGFCSSKKKHRHGLVEIYGSDLFGLQIEPFQFLAALVRNVQDTRLVPLDHVRIEITDDLRFIIEVVDDFVRGLGGRVIRILDRDDRTDAALGQDHGQRPLETLAEKLEFENARRRHAREDQERENQKPSGRDR
ncbi:MAG: hypothetical protein M5R36_15050 [Deltaproteobacteria bacterium]|nr:hypothetical protein [Deltaproteobacteria bacterium]